MPTAGLLPMVTRPETEAVYWWTAFAGEPSRKCPLKQTSTRFGFTTQSENGRIRLPAVLLGHWRAQSRTHSDEAAIRASLAAAFVKRSFCRLETAIHKMTGLPARRVGLRNCGLLKEGMFADITILDPQRVIDRTTFEMPNQYREGINYVIINGKISVDQGQRTAALAGGALRGPGYRR